MDLVLRCKRCGITLGTSGSGVSNNNLSVALCNTCVTKGTFECKECGSETKEENAVYYGYDSFCSNRCVGKFIGVENDAVI